MKKLQKIVLVLSKIGLVLMFVTLTTFMVREFFKCQDLILLPITFFVGLMLATFYPIFLTFFSLSGIINGGEVTLGALFRFAMACLLFFAAKHCLGIVFGATTSFPSHAYDLLLTETVTKVITIVIIAYAIKHFRIVKLSTS